MASISFKHEKKKTPLSILTYFLKHERLCRKQLVGMTGESSGLIGMWTQIVPL